MQAASVVAVAGSMDLAKPIIARAEQADGSSPVSDQAILAATQGQRELLLFSEAEAEQAHDAQGGSGEQPPVAVAILGQGELDLVVDPPARGRGVGTAALRELLTLPRAAEAGPDREPGLLAWAHGENPAATALLRGAGFAAVRSLYRMALDPSLLPARTADPFAVEFPAGYELRAFDADRAASTGHGAGQPGDAGTEAGAEAPADAGADASAWVAVNARAFATHPEQGRVTLADFALMRAEDWFDPNDLFLLAAPEGEDLAGFTWVKTLRDGERTETELYAIGVDPAQAGRGLGRALLDVTLARMAQHAPERVTLYVDGENERAVHMYEAAGFTIDSRSTQWRGPGGRQVSE